MRDDIDEICYGGIYFAVGEDCIADMLVCFYESADIKFRFASSFDFDGIDIGKYLLEFIYRTEIF